LSLYLSLKVQTLRNSHINLPIITQAKYRHQPTVYSGSKLPTLRCWGCSSLCIRRKCVLVCWTSTWIYLKDSL